MDGASSDKMWWLHNILVLRGTDGVSLVKLASALELYGNCLYPMFLACPLASYCIPIVPNLLIN